MFEDVIDNLQARCAVFPSQTILVGVSGGPDSICLMDILHEHGYPIVVGYFHHQLRPEADLEARGVEKMCSSLGITYCFGSGNTVSYARQNSMNIEEAARKLRYLFLFSQAKIQHAQGVAVAHTADDQVETLLMHLLRGSGLSGMVGMQYRALPNAWSNEIPLIRPLISVWKTEIQTYLEQRGLETFVDLSNRDIRYTRNRVRQELLPYLETFNPQIKKTLWQTADLLAADFQELNDRCEIEWDNCLVEVGEGYICLDRLKSKDLPSGLQRCLIRHGMQQLQPGLIDVDYATIQRARACLKGLHGHQCDLIAGLRLMVEDQYGWILAPATDLPHNRWPQVTDDKTFSLNVPSSMKLSDTWKMAIEMVENTDAIMERVQANRDPYQAWLAEKKIEFPVTIRARRVGDRFKPLGMDCKSMKVSDFMINQKIPARARASWPLVCCGDDIIWIPGFQISHPYRALPDSERLIRFHLLSI